MSRCTVKIEDPERRDTWRRVLGTDADEVPVTGPELERVRLPGYPEGDLVYMVDLTALDAGQRERLVDHLSARFRIRRELVARDLDRVGVPIRAEALTLLVDGVPAKPEMPLPPAIDLRHIL